MVMDKKSQEKIQLNTFLHKFLKTKFKKDEDMVDSMMASIVYSSYRYKEKYPDCDIFYKFMSDLYQPLELSYFIFVR